MGAEELSRIQENVDLAIEELGPLSDVDFGLNRESVEWVEGFVERQRSRPDFDLERAGGLVGVLGSFLGACVVAATGGHWRWSDDDGWGVLLPEGSTVFPFTKVNKQFRMGLEEGESIAGFYRIAVDVIATGRMREARGNGPAGPGGTDGGTDGGGSDGTDGTDGSGGTGAGGAGGAGGAV